MMNGLNEIMHAKNVAIGIAHLRGSVNVSNHWCFEIPIKKKTLVLEIPIKKPIF